jgi:hypothetical protein
MLPSVNVIYLRIYQKLILMYHKQRREKMYWEASGKISKLKTIFYKSHYCISTIHRVSNNLLLQPQNRYTV